jgi:Tfp pilus assembly major pilin PilA
MKCDELKRKYSDITGPYYGYNEVNEAVAELKDVIHELQVDLEGAKATAYADSVDAGMRERRLRRALYKACANWALTEIECEQLDSQMFAFGMTSDKEVAWKKVERKCLKKAEEYK